MNVCENIAKQLRDLHGGGNWTGASFKEKLADVTWEQARSQADSFHTIAALVYHTNYFVAAALQVMRGGPLDASDKVSFDHPPIECSDDWDRLLDKLWSEAEALAGLIERMPEQKLWEDFAGGKYGNYYRNLTGIVEHAHYHLGQIAIVKKLIYGAS